MKFKETLYIVVGLLIVLMLGGVLDYVQSSLTGQLVVNSCFLFLAYLVYWRLRGKLSRHDVVKGAFIFAAATAAILARYWYAF